MLEKRIEEAALKSWPAHQQLLFDGWVIRFAQGYSKRANSVTPLYPSVQSEKILHCEQLYKEKHLPIIFRLPSFSAESQQLDQLLAQRGYRTLDHVQALFTYLNSNVTTENSAWQALPLANWLPIFYQFSPHSLERQALHRSILERIMSPFVCAALYQQGRPVACGLGVQEQEAFGIFNIVTDPEQRRKGYGGQLLAGMLAWGRQQGAEIAYLQVLEANQVALRLYAKLGFQLCYRYWYRQAC